MGTLRADRLLVQAELEVGRVDDPAEREADRVAGAAMARLGGGSTPTTSAPGRPDALGGLPVDAGIEQRINRARAGGAPLDRETAGTMGDAMGADLSGVRIHHDAESDRLSRSLEAKAFTTGRDVFFRQGAYRPDHDAGKTLLAHELAHVAQQGGVRRTVHRAFEPANANLTSISAAKPLSGGMANKGVFLLTGEGGVEMVAKFIDEDPRRAQMADVVLQTGGLNASGAKPYGMDVGKQVLVEVRRLAVARRNAGDEEGAKKLESTADRAESEGKGVVFMKKMTGADLGDILYGYNKRANDAEKKKATDSGVNPVALLANPRFHHNLGRMYVADGLLGSSDRLFHDGARGRLNSKNLKVLADGTINTFDSDTVLISHDVLKKAKDAKDKSADNWTQWLIKGGMVWDIGLDAPGGQTHDLTSMFDVKSRQEVFAEVVDSFKSMADSLDWSTTTLDFATFDTNFMAGLVAGLKALVAQMDQLVQSTKDIGGDDSGAGAVDPQAMSIKAAYLRGVLPDLEHGGVISQKSKTDAYEDARRLANKLVRKNEVEAHALELASFDNSLLPVPTRPAKLKATEKFGRKFGRLTGKIGGRSQKSRDSKRAKRLRKGAEDLDLEGLSSAREEVSAMGGASRRQRHAEFDIGMRHAVLAMHRRAVAFGEADTNIMRLQTGVSDRQATREHLAPYLRVVNAGGYTNAVKKFHQVADGYKAELNRSGDGAAAADLDKAKKIVDDEMQGFEAGVDWIERQLKR